MPALGQDLIDTLTTHPPSRRQTVARKPRRHFRALTPLLLIIHSIDLADFPSSLRFAPLALLYGGRIYQMSDAIHIRRHIRSSGCRMVAIPRLSLEPLSRPQRLQYSVACGRSPTRAIASLVSTHPYLHPFRHPSRVPFAHRVVKFTRRFWWGVKTHCPISLSPPPHASLSHRNYAENNPPTASSQLDRLGYGAP